MLSVHVEAVVTSDYLVFEVGLRDRWKERDKKEVASSPLLEKMKLK